MIIESLSLSMLQIPFDRFKVFWILRLGTYKGGKSTEPSSWIIVHPFRNSKETESGYK